MREQREARANQEDSPYDVVVLGRARSARTSPTVAVAGELPLKRLRHAIACFPTVSEIWLFLLAAYHRDRT
ncbi:hypothetical protein ACF08M_08225 [Streptomyces sp. NPDC015032]|uniref:hypothetical protein n=1 Tax=Streptomyces sp. NPDC015032 TaxID=3364937 RepID=UPI0036F6CE52